MQEPAEPDALAPAALADPVHAVVPVAGADQRQAVRAGQSRLLVEAARAVLEERRRLVGRPRLEERVVLAGRERRALEERNDLVEDRRVAGRLDVVRSGSRRARRGRRRCGCARPGRTAAATSAGRRPRRTAAPRRAAGARAPARGRAKVERHAVLQLVAEAVGAARLVEGRARPDAAGERLVEQPAVEHDVHRAVGRAAPGRVPSSSSQCACDLRAGPRRGRPRGSARSALAPPRVEPAWPSKNDDLDALARAELDRRLQRRAGIEPGPGRARSSGAFARAPPGSPGVPLRPRNSRPVGGPGRSAGRRGRRRRRARRSAVLHGLRASSAPVSRVDLGDDRNGAAAPREVPSTHSDVARSPTAAACRPTGCGA